MIIVWNFWVPSFLYSSSVAYYGSGHTDFNIFYNAGWLWLHGENPYPLDAFVYPPASIPFFGLYALLPIEQGAQAWMATYFLVFIAALLALGIPLERERRSLFFCITPLLAFTSYPLLIMMSLGQSDLFVSSLAMLSFAALRFKRVNASAVLLSAAVLMKASPVFLLIYFILYRRDFSYLLRFVAATSGIVLLSLLVVPTQLYSSYFSLVAPQFSTAASAEASSNQSLTGFVSLFGFGHFSSIVALAGVGLFGAFAFYAGGRNLSVSGGSSLSGDAMFLMNILVMLALGPRSWPANYVWVILPVALFLSTIIVAHVRLAYLASVGFAAFLLNANLTQEFFNYAILPLALLGNLLLTLLLIPKCLQSPFLKDRTGKSRL